MGNFIEIEVYAHNDEGNGYQWESGAISLIGISGDWQFPLNEEGLRELRESIEEVKPIKNERWHKIKMEEVWERDDPHYMSVRFYTLESIGLVPHPCAYCSKELSKQDSDLCDEYGQDPFCSQYCFEKHNGTPMPINSGDLVFDKWNNNNR
jgi:hypothetical protein